MLYTLENATIKITADTQGGEMHSLTHKPTGEEYLWNGDPAYWKYHAPLLFPIIGRVIDHTYRVNGQNYELPQHGFARISQFALTAQTAESLTFTLQSSPQTNAVYPFAFAFDITYTLLADGVETRLTVHNKDAKPILFSLGSHPAFLCPLDSSDALTDCYLEFSERETAPILPLAKSGFLSHTPQPYLQDESVINLHQDLFHNDALIFHQLRSKSVAIKSKNNTKSLAITIDEFPFVGIWAPASGAPFLCIEPWHGHCDYDGFTGEFSEKAGIITLPVGESFTCSYQMKITP